MSAEAAPDLLGLRVPSEVHPGVEFWLERRLGIGASAVAYLARRVAPRSESLAVVKIILPRVVLQAGEAASMVVRKEAVALGRLNERTPPSPFVVRFLDAGLLPSHAVGQRVDLPWLAVEYVHGGIEGTTLEERVLFSLRHTGSAFDRQRAARLVAQICQGLEEVHAVGVIHRDLNPRNVLCCGFGETELYKLSDFGIARPLGMDATFGPTVLGTAGYIAPEQGFQTEGGATAVSDIFSVAAIIYFALTGTSYFDDRNAVESLLQARTAQRRTLDSASGLCMELRSEGGLLRGLDEALARATAFDPANRPPTPRALAASLLLCLGDDVSAPPSRRHVSSVLRAEPGTAVPGWNWVVRHPPSEERLLLSVAWDSAGHALAVTDAGLRYWDGTSFTAMSRQDLPLAGRPCFVSQSGPGCWLIGGEGAALLEYSRSGVTRVLRGPRPDLCFVRGDGDLGDLCAVISEQPAGPPLLCGLAAGRWLKPLPVPLARTLLALVRIDDLEWLVVGRGDGDGAYAGIYRPLQWEVQPLPVPQARALVACGGQRERDLALAAGSHGAILRVHRGESRSETLEGEPSLSAVAVDVVGRTWVGAAGGIWLRSPENEHWQLVWSDPAWCAPVVSLHVDLGRVVAMMADGGVIEGQAESPARSFRPHSDQRAS